MAVKDCEVVSNIMATSLIAGDDELAQEIARLSLDKRNALARARNLREDKELDLISGKPAHELELKAQSADVQLRAITQAKILAGKGNDRFALQAREALAEEIRKQHGTLAGGLDLLDKLREADVADWGEVARLWGGSDTTGVIDEINTQISNFVASNYSIRQYSDFVNDGIAEAKKQFRAGKITEKQLAKDLAEMHDEAMKAIKEGKNPAGFAKLDEEWQAIKKMYPDNPKQQAQMWDQYVMARELLSDGVIGEAVFKEFKDVCSARNLTGPLTYDELAKYGAGDLNKLLARAYTNTRQLVNDSTLREAYRQKLVEVTSGMLATPTTEARIRSIINTLGFADQGATFSDILKRDNVLQTCKRRGLDVSGTNGEKLYEALKVFARNVSEDPAKIPAKIDISGVVMKPADVIQMIYDATGDKNIIKLIEVGQFDDNTILDISTQYLLGNNRAASSKILALFSKAKETSDISNVRDLALKTTTGVDIKDGARVGFFDFREGLYIKDELNRTRADFMDALANKNKINIAKGIDNFTENGKSVDNLTKALEGLRGGYLVVNDAKWKDNEILREAMDKVNAGLDEDSSRFVHVIFPNRAMSANFSMENGVLVFKTIDDQLYRDVSGTLSIQTLGQAQPTKEIQELAKESATGRDLAGNTVDSIDALYDYSDALDNAAMKYFGSMLGVSGKKVDATYIQRTKELLAEKVGLDIKAFDQIKDKSKLWAKIDKKFAIAKLTAGKYDTEVAKISDIVNGIKSLSNDDLANRIGQELGEIVSPSAIRSSNNIDAIREAFINYKIAPTPVDSMGAKGRIISLANGGEAPTLSMDEIKNMFQNPTTMADTYKRLFFPNQKLTKEQLTKYINEINDGIFDSLSATFAENLVDAGYALPLINIRTLVYDYLTGNVDVNNEFVQAFLLKNNINVSRDSLNVLLNALMPKEYRFGYEGLLYQGAKYSPNLAEERAVVKEVKNQFLQDSYSALGAIEMVKKGDVPTGYERKFLQDILGKYYEAFKKGLTEGITFQQAQAIKQEASYALDMFEQDFLMSRYGKFMSTAEKQGLMGMKYSLPIGVSGQDTQAVLKEINKNNERLLKNYDRTLKDIAKNNDINAAVYGAIKSESARMDRAIEQRRKLLMEQGAVIREVNGQYLVYDAKQALKETLDTLPKDITGLEQIKSLGSDGIRQLTNPQAYSLLRYIEATKALATRANYVTELMYKQNPLLLKYAFFDTFKIGPNGLPKALSGNTLLGLKNLEALDNTASIDGTIKKEILKGIKEEFNKNGYIDEKALKEIISKRIAENESNFLGVLNLSPREIKKMEKGMALLYKNAFIPYTYLRDIPTGGVVDDVVIPNIKEKVKTLITQQYDQAIADLKAMGYTDLDKMQDNIWVTLASGEKKNLRQLADVNIDNWKKDIFDDESVFVKAADEVKTFLPEDYKNFYTSMEKAQDKAVRQEKEWREKIVNGYNSTLQAMMSGTHIVSEAENNLLTSFMNDVRVMLKRGSLTNMIVDATDALAGLNEEAARGIKDYLIGFKGQMTFGAVGSKNIMARYEKVKKAYAEYYGLSLDRLNKIKPSNRAEDLALKLAKYFKTLEQHLGSADGLTGCTTKQEINRAFYHIGEVFNNIKDVSGVFGMLSGIEQNQILKFFKFSNPNNLSYVEKFIRKGAHETGGLGGYRDYVTDVSGITQREFNDIFGSAFDEDEFKQVLQGLTGFTITGPWGRTAQRILNLANGSNFIARLFMSYPGQIFTIPWQSAAYFLKQKWHEGNLGMETMSEIDAIRSSYKVLDGAYNEINLWGKSLVNPDDVNPMSFYNRYGVPDVERIYKNTDIQTADNYLDMYAKIDDYAIKNAGSRSWWKRQLDPYKDNANNIIDGLFARNFKNVSFAKALKENDFLQFSSAKAFKEFMDNPSIDAGVKRRLMERVNAYSGRNFRNILGLGFGGLDRAVGGGGLGNIFYGLMQFLNFRGAWGQNIFKQSGEFLGTMLKMIFQKGNNVWSREGRDAIVKYVASQPEFMNFIGALYNDVVWTWKLQRFQDNGRWTGETEYDLLDFINYFTDTLNMTSQWYQGIQSFGPMRPIIEMGESRMAHLINPTIYKDTWGVGALFNAIGKNAGRQWKPYNWIAKAIGAYTTDGRDGAMAYVQNKFWELSFGSLRYMAGEDLNLYGYTYEVTGQVGGIPSILMGEAPIGSDKSFSYELDNNETWETMEMLAQGDVSWDDKWTYLGNLKKTLVNGSQFFSLFKNIGKAKNRRAASYFTADDLAETIQKTKAGMEFYQKGYVTPTTPEEARKFINNMLANGKYRPGSISFNNSLMQFEDYGHMNGKAKGNPKDEEMEFWLSHMKYQTRDDGTFVTNKNGRVEDPSWRVLVEDVRAHFKDEGYCRDLIYAYSQKWLDAHSADPNYQLYIKMMGQGAATMTIDKYMTEIIAARNVGQKGADNRRDQDEFKKGGDYDRLLLLLGNSRLPGEDKTLFDKLQVLDQDASTLTALELIENQTTDIQDKETLSRFYTIEKDDDGTETATINNQYRGFLTQVGAMSRALSEGNIERFIAEASSLTHQFKNDDPVGAITASMIDSVYRRIYDTNSLTPLQKQEAMIALFHDNKEFIQHNGAMLKEYLGNDYDEYARLMNEMLYQWDGELISNLESIYTSGEDEKKTKAAGAAAAKMSSDLKSMALDVGGVGSNGGTRSSSSYGQWVPVTIKGANLVKELGLKGYTPADAGLEFQGYKPHSDFSVAKDINRNVKGPKTQAVTKKKQLSKLESDTEKALEAES